MAQAWWETIDEIPHPDHPPPGPTLYFQKGRYHFHDGRPSEDGVRFIWRQDTGHLQSRPARIDGLKDIDQLMTLARQRGW
jgi:hypothetical protein